MAQTVTFQGKPLTLIGNAITVGMQAPEFEVISQDMKEVRLSDFKGKTKIVSTFPSLDTPVCDLQVKEFNKHASAFSADIIVIGISKDLPFAIKRFCSENSIKSEVVLSDYKTSSFGMNYGLLIKELNLLGRSVQIIGKDGIVRYRQVVQELTLPPNYEEVLGALKSIL